LCDDMFYEKTHLIMAAETANKWKFVFTVEDNYCAQ